MKRSTLIETILFLFVSLFLYTGISKFMDYSLFREQIAVSPVLAPVAPLIARSLPFLELVLAVMLVVPRWRLKGLYLSTALMAAFTIYIIAMMLFHDTLPCSCGGILAQLSWGQHIVFNSVFIFLGLSGIYLERKERRQAGAIWNSIGKPVELKP